MMGERRCCGKLVVTVALVAALALGGLWPAASPIGWAAGSSTLIWGQSGNPDTLDMPISSSGESAEVVTQMFNGLVRALPGRTDVEPDLATSWSVSPDGLTWTFKLRRGVIFHDGTPWDAAAAKFNFDRWSDPKNPYHKVGALDFEYFNDFLADTFQEVRAPDPGTLQIVLKAPSAPLVYNLSIIAFDFASPASIQKYGGDSASGVSRHPVGTGPYKFVDWVQDDHITMVASPSFFRKGLPKTHTLVYRVLKDNAARFLALKSGEIQAMELPNPDDARTARSDPTLKVGERPSFNTGWLQMNLNLPFFKDIRIRRAMAMAINRKAIVQGLYGGLGEVADQYMPPTMWGRSSSPMIIPYDPAAARKLLAEAGYPNGFSLDFWYLPISRPYFPDGKEIGTAMANDLGKIGIRSHVMTEESAVYQKDSNTNKFQVWMRGWIGDNGDPDDWLGFFFGHHDPKNARFSYDNPTVIALVKQARTLNSQAERAKIYARVGDLALADLPMIPIAHAKVPVVMRSNVYGLVPQPDGNEYMETVELK